MRITDLSASDLTIALHEPFGIATGAQARADNLLVRVTLEDGTQGIGEGAPFPAVNGETREMVRAAVARVELAGRSALEWRAIALELARLLPESPSARCAIETALLDALCRHAKLPMWAFFGGVSRELTTDMTVTTGDIAHASRSAAAIAARGFSTLKLKVGGASLALDVERVAAVHAAAPGCALLIDANGGMASVEEALQLLARSRALGARVVAFEQPIDKHDVAAQRTMCARSPVPVIADESCGSLADVVRIASEKLAHGVNLKMMKSGLVQALDMAIAARACGLQLMIGGMVESEIAMTTSACLAAGLGGFVAVDLDTHLFLDDSPVRGGISGMGPRLDLSAIASGHGCAVA